MWKCDGESWWCKIEYNGAINSKLRRRIFRSVRATLDQEAKRWKEWSQLRTRIEWLEAREQEGLEQGKQNSDDLVGFQHMGARILQGEPVHVRSVGMVNCFPIR